MTDTASTEQVEAPASTCTKPERSYEDICLDNDVNVGLAYDF